MAWSKLSRQARGYGRAHELMRARVLAEEPLCYLCLAKTPPQYTPATIADHKTAKAEGGTDDRDNYGGACKPCHDAKTAQEAARAQGRSPSLPRPPIGIDGWPLTWPGGVSES